MTYSSSLAVGRSQFAPKNQNATTFKTTDRSLGPVSNTIILIVLACLIGLLYLTQVTKTNAYSYKINSLQTEQSNLAQENSDLQVASARLQSLERVKSSSVAKHLVSVAPSASIQN